MVKHVLFLCDYFPPDIGGIEVVNKALTDALTDDTRVTVVCRRTPGLPRVWRENNLTIFRVPSPTRNLHPLTAWNTARRAAKAADIIHVSPYASAYLAALLMPFFRKKPFLLHVHGFLGKKLTGSLYGGIFARLVVWYEHLMFLVPWTQVVCVSRSLKERLLGDRVINEQAEVIHNGIDTTLFAPREDTLRAALGFRPEDVIFVYAGRPSPLKGTDLILEALPAVMETHPELHMAFFVPDQDKGNWKIFQETLRKLGHHERVHLFPSRPHEEMPKVFAMADLVLIPSRSEGFCFQAAEACALGTPVLCPRQDSFPEIVSGKALFVELSPEGVREGMERFFRQAWEMQPPREFPWSKAVAAWRELYARLAG